MGKGIDLARVDAPEHAALLDDLKDQLLCVLLRRLGGDITVSVEEVDDTGTLLFMMSLDLEKRMFHFELRKKS